MPKGANASAQRAVSVRQSVTIPAELALEVRRVARKHHLTMSRALVHLAQRGADAEAESRRSLRTSYRRFLSETDPHRKDEAGKDLIRAVFGADAIAEDPLL